MASRNRVVVTGGAGFIGYHLVKRLLAEGNVVVAVDNLFSGRRKNVAEFADNPRFDFVHHDIISPLFIEADQVYNLACPASPIHYQFNSIRTVKTNVTGTLNMLGLAKRCGAKFLQASTSEVYGDPEVHPQVESYRGAVNTVGPRACYDEGKRIAETLCHDYHFAHGVDVCIARIFNTYGPRMRFEDGRVISNFVIQALNNEPLTIYGDGSQTRSFCFVDDLVDGLIRLMHGDRWEPVNLGNPHELTILEIAQLVRDTVGSSSEITFKPLPTDDPTRRCPDISRAKEWLGWEPKVPVAAGVKATVDDFRARLSADDEY
jgi:UDP-glucuronate decarboxylase